MYQVSVHKRYVPVFYGKIDILFIYVLHHFANLIMIT